MGPWIGNAFSSITNKMQCYAIYLFLWNALHVSGGSSTHHQELKNCLYSILSNRYCYLPLVPPPIIRSSKTVYKASCQTVTANCRWFLHPSSGAQKLYIQHLVKPLLLPAAIAAGSSNGLTRCCIYSFWAPGDGWRNQRQVAVTVWQDAVYTVFELLMMGGGTAWNM